MKTSLRIQQEGSVLLIAFLTMAILALICAVSLNVATQDANATTQTTSWQQALAAAEGAADQAMSALNTGTWGASPQWYTVTGSPPATRPTAGSAAVGPPGDGQYNYCIPTPLALQGEASNTMAMWVTVDTAGLPPNSSGLQAYRIRAVGSVNAPGPARVSNQKLDNDLRKINLIVDRKSGQSVNSQPMATRRIELIAVPVTKSIWSRGISLKSSITMSGGGVVDSFDSCDPSKSTNGLYDITKRQSHGEIATINSTGSDLKSTYVYGNVQYSGPAIKNTGNVQGTISTPFNATIPATVDPTASSWWDTGHDGVQQQPYFQSGNYTNYGGGSPPMATISVTGTSSSPTFIKISGDLTVPGGQTLSITSPSNQNGNQSDKYVTIWVTGKFTTSGTGLISQDPNVHVIWIVDGDITTSGGSYNNQSGHAGNVAFIGVGTHNKITVSGSANFIGTMNAPGYDATVSGSGNFSGALIANTLTISGGASFHYDECLESSGGGSSSSNFAYASWFEDNSAPAHGQTY